MSRPQRSSASEDIRDVAEALAGKLDARTVVVSSYVAVGSTSARVALASPDQPLAILLIDARLYFDLNAPVTVTPSFGFVWDAGTQTAQVYEPSGLTANTVYQLTFLVIGG
jgi:hypothetical protein